jgi:hypothetical protein
VLFRLLLGYLIAPKTKPKYQLLFKNIKNSSSTGVSFFTRDNKKKKKKKTNKQTRGVSHHGLAIYIKTYLKAKEE